MRRAAPCRAWPFDEAQHFAHGDGSGRPRQQVAAFGAAARFHKPALLQAGQDQLQELLRDLLPPRDIGDLHRLARRLRRQIEDGLQSVFAFPERTA